MRDGERERVVRKVRNLSNGAHKGSHLPGSARREGEEFNPPVLSAPLLTSGHSIPQILCTPGNSPDFSVSDEKIGQVHQVLLFCISTLKCCLLQGCRKFR